MSELNKHEKYLKNKVDTIQGYIITHLDAARKGIPVCLDEIPQDLRGVIDLAVRTTYLDQDIKIQKLEKQLKAAEKLHQHIIELLEYSEVVTELEHVWNNAENDLEKYTVEYKAKQ